MDKHVIESVLWRRLDVPGHDAAFVLEREAGFLLRGVAVFRDPKGAACIEYAVALDAGWRTLSATARGFVGSRQVSHTIERVGDIWTLDGRAVTGLAAFVDIDFGFTPATNMQLLRRAAPAVGDTLNVSVVWFDIDQDTLIELPQRYSRRDETTYWYESPTAAYEGLLELAPNGFAKSYPGLWEIESRR